MEKLNEHPLAEKYGLTKDDEDVLTPDEYEEMMKESSSDDEKWIGGDSDATSAESSR